MSGNSSNGPMLKAAGLWAKTSVKGGQYLTGRLGGVKVLVMENRDRQGDDGPSHILYFAEAPDRRQGGQQGVQERSGGAGIPSTSQRPSGGRRSAFLAPAARDRALDDAPGWAG